MGLFESNSQYDFSTSDSAKTESGEPAGNLGLPEDHRVALVALWRRGMTERGQRNTPVLSSWGLSEGNTKCGC